MTSVSRKARHWVIGDVHGCSDSLEQLLAQLPQGDRLIFCGDAINRGPDTPATMERIWGLVDSGRGTGCPLSVPSHWKIFPRCISGTMFGLKTCRGGTSMCFSKPCT